MTKTGAELVAEAVAARAEREARDKVVYDNWMARSRGTVKRPSGAGEAVGKGCAFAVIGLLVGVPVLGGLAHLPPLFWIIAAAVCVGVALASEN